MFKFVSQMLRFIADRRGNFAVTFAFVAMTLTLGVGSSIDLVRAYNTRVKLQANLDSALLAGIKKVTSTSDTAALKTSIITWLTAQKINDGSSYDITPNDITINANSNTIVATARARLPASFLKIANVQNLNVAVSSSVVGPSSSYLNIYIVLDKSASMLLAATSSGQTSMRNYGGCVFGCHTNDGPAVSYNGHSYTTNYDLAKAMGVTMRADVSVTAAKQVLSLISAADPSQSHFRVGLYTMGSALTEVVAPTFNISTATSALNSDTRLTSATSETTSRFDSTLPALTTIVGTAGDGTTSSKPMKLVLLLTDGATSERDWVLNDVSWDSQGKMVCGSNCWWYKVAPLNPTWCSTMKTNKATVGVLYTEYLSIPWDEGYVHTMGDTMRSANWNSTWGGVMDTGVSNSTARRDYLPYALKGCASSSDMFVSASSTSDIEKGLSSLFQIYVGSVRLTQ